MNHPSPHGVHEGWAEVMASFSSVLIYELAISALTTVLPPMITPHQYGTTPMYTCSLTIILSIHIFQTVDLLIEVQSVHVMYVTLLVSHWCVFTCMQWQLSQYI